MTSGIYSITNTVTGKRYIGSATNIKRRWDGHKSYLRRNRHHSKELQRSYNKHGKDKFQFDIIYECHKSQLIFYEQLFIDFNGGTKVLYNECPIVGSTLGITLSEKTREKMQLVHNGYSVIWIDTCGNILGKYKSLREAASQTGIDSGAISRSVKFFYKCKNTMFVKSEEDIELVLQKNKDIIRLHKQKMKQKSKQKCSKSIYQIDKKTNKIIGRWNCIREAGRELKISSSNISACALGKSSFSGGFVWRYVGDTDYQAGDMYNN